MKIYREWVTPVAAGAFMLSAITGILIFFRLDVGLNRPAHEWMSWVLLIGVSLHLTANFAGFKRLLQARRTRLLLSLFALVLTLSFFGKKNEPPYAPPLRALAAAPLTTLAQLAQIDNAELRARLLTLDLKPSSDSSDQQSLRELTGPDMRKQVQALGALFRRKE